MNKALFPNRKNFPLIMGILNITPDSFSDGGQFNTTKKALKKGLEMIEEGADIIDIGGESTGPNSQNIDAETEIKRVIPVIERLIRAKKKFKKRVLISLDTYKPEVAYRGIELGIDMINDVTALRTGKMAMAKLIANAKIPLVLMYSKDSTPRTTSKKIAYQDIIKTIKRFLKERIKFALQHGIKQNQIIIDPGMGAFVSGIGKYSFEILKRLSELKKLGFPILVGTSRKGFLGEALGGIPVDQRLEASLVTSLIAIQNGASIVRVHDVKEIKIALKILANRYD